MPASLTVSQASVAALAPATSTVVWKKKCRRAKAELTIILASVVIQKYRFYSDDSVLLCVLLPVWWILRYRHSAWRGYHITPECHDIKKPWYNIEDKTTVCLEDGGGEKAELAFCKSVFRGRKHIRRHTTVIQTIHSVFVCLCVFMQDTGSLKQSVKSGRAAGKAIHQSEA